MDKRLKENIFEIKNPIDKIKQIRGVHFDWKDKVDDVGFHPDIRKDEVGVIAQEIEAVIPQAVYNAPFDMKETIVAHESGSTSIGNPSHNPDDIYKTVKLEKIVIQTGHIHQLLRS